MKKPWEFKFVTKPSEDEMLTPRITEEPKPSKKTNDGLASDIVFPDGAIPDKSGRLILLDEIPYGCKVIKVHTCLSIDGVLHYIDTVRERGCGIYSRITNANHLKRKLEELYTLSFWGGKNPIFPGDCILDKHKIIWSVQVEYNPNNAPHMTYGHELVIQSNHVSKIHITDITIKFTVTDIDDKKYSFIILYNDSNVMTNFTTKTDTKKSVCMIQSTKSFGTTYRLILEANDTCLILDNLTDNQIYRNNIF